MYIQTPHFTLERENRTGNLILRDRETGRAHYVQGEDVTLLEAELEHCPARYLDTVLADFERGLA